MERVSVDEAAANLDGLVDRAIAGEHIVIVLDNEDAVTLTPLRREITLEQIRERREARGSQGVRAVDDLNAMYDEVGSCDHEVGSERADEKE